MARNPTLPRPSFTYINITAANSMTNGFTFGKLMFFLLIINNRNFYFEHFQHFERIQVPSSLKVAAKNSSVIIQISPNSTLVGYFIFLKFGAIPWSNYTQKDYNKVKGFCPTGITLFYLF
jgi:hypothetical protein